MKKTAVAILNWNGVKFLQQFLPTLIQHTPNAEIIVIDNQSTDDSVSFLKKYPQIRMIQNSENAGFAKGYNDGLKQIEGEFEYYAIINSDVEVTPNWLSPLIEKLENNPKVAGVQPKVLAFHNKEFFEHAGASGGFIDKNFYPFCRGRIFDKVEKDRGQYDDEMEIFWTTGACMVVRAETFHALGGFDPDFFAHMEEIDFCWRVKRRNLSFFVIPSSKVYHVGGGTLNYQSPQKTYLNFRNNLYMIHKNYGGWLFGKMFFRMCLDGIAGVKYLLSFQPKHTWAIIKAHFSYYGTRTKLHQKRKKLIQESTVFNSAGLYNTSILWSFYFKGIRRFRDLNL
ncbi:MAG: glycosyltransferase family 2 protein [Brumimicrobium sp.]